MAKRPWYDLHWPTWLILLIVFQAMVLAQSTGPAAFEFDWSDINQYSSAEYNFLSANGHFGWPLIYPYNIKLPPNAHSTGIVWLLNFLACFAAFASTAFVAENWFRSRARWQLKLSTALSVLAVISVLLRLDQRGPWFWQYGVFDYALIQPTAANFTWYICVPLVLALTCTIHTAGWLAFRGAAWCVRLVSRKTAEPMTTA